VSRKLKTDPKVGRAVEKAPILASSPVSRILSDIFGDRGQSRLNELASRIAGEPFDLRKFRSEISAKLDRAVPTDRPDASRVSFARRLQRSGSVATILKKSTLLELRNCLLIPVIFDRDRELERKSLSPAGLALRTHLKSARAAEARMREIERQAEIDGTNTDTEEYRRLNRQFRDDMILVILSKRRPGSRKELLSGQPARNLRRKPRRKTVAAAVAIFWILRTRLPRRQVSDRFIHHLVVLISEPDRRVKMDDDELLQQAEALRKALADDPAEWEDLLDLP
jgi:hypothetical protein